jgi:hypothetical protein
MAQKYDHIDFKPPQSVADAAAQGLEYRQKASPSNRGGLTPSEASKEGIGSGVQRAVNLKNRDTISPEVIGQMVAFFARHKKNKSISAENKGTPWNDKGYVAHLLWGGDPGEAWANKVKKQMESADKASKTARAMTDQEFEKTRVDFEHRIKLVESVFKDTFDLVRDNPQYASDLGFDVGASDEVIFEALLQRRAGLGAREFNPYIRVLINKGYSYIKALPFSLQVPASSRRTYENLTKEFSRTRDMKDWSVWWIKVRKETMKFLESTRHWKALDQDAVAEAESVPSEDQNVTLIGKIKVINQSGKDPAKTIEGIRRCTQQLMNSGVPKIADVLYGNMLVVGDVGRKKTVAALYYIDYDHIEIRAVSRFDEHFEHSVIHELGHRYWRKFVSREVKEMWSKHHSEILYGDRKRRPEVGEVLSFVKGAPVVTKVTWDKVYVSDRESISLKDYQKFMRMMSFPTLYSEASLEEHFCEALALFCLGKLEGQHLEAFKRIVIGQGKTARRW